MLEIGRIIDGRWRIEAEIGEGGVARVFRVRHTRLDTLYALKVLKVQGAVIAQRLAREGKVQASLRHENVLEVTDVFDVDGSPGLLMRYIDGPALSHWLEDNRPSLAQAETLFRGILAGVGRAHSLGVIHRDLKPGNILLMSADDGRLIPKVADFGLAKVLSEDHARADATRSGMAMGTPAYMAPEQFRGTKDVDQRADIFALGCILYELACGQRPFPGNDIWWIHQAVAGGQYIPPERLAPTLPWHLTKAIQVSLHPDPGSRPESCESLLLMLDDPARVWSPAKDFATRPRADAGGALGFESAMDGSVPSPRPAAPLTAASTAPVLDSSLASLDAPWSGGHEPTATRVWPKRAPLIVVAIAALAASIIAWRLEHPAEDTSIAELATDPASSDESIGATEAALPPAPAVAQDPAPETLEAPAAAPARRPTPAVTTALVVPEKTVPTPTTPMATVRVGGDPATITLIDDAGVAWPPGAVHPGRYTVDANFGTETIRGVAELYLTEGQATTLTCRAKFARCTPR